jgi:hypothetical protein
MEVKQETPVAGGVSLTRGPLLFSLNIKEDKTPITTEAKTSAAFPAWDIKPGSAWNYSLADHFNPKDVKVITRPLKGFPWLPENSPLTLVVSGRAIPAWQDSVTTPPLPKPGFQTQKTQKIQLIPDGATRIRVSVFPVSKS